MNDSQAIRVVVVDDHAVVRSGLRLFLLGFDDIDLVGEAASGEEALRICRSLTPDVVLMDMIMPGMDGVETTRRLLDLLPEVQVVVLSSFQEGDLVQKALQAGAIGYLLKDATGDELARAIRDAFRGKPSLAPGAAGALVRSARMPPIPEFRLTDRQVQVLKLLVEGRSNAEIAKMLVISQATARFHVSNILAELGAANRAEAAALAVKHGLV